MRGIRAFTLLCLLVSSQSLGGQLATVVKPKVNIRSGPSTKSTIVASAVAGESFPVVNRNGSWIQIDLRGTYAWVYSTLVRIEDTGSRSSRGPSCDPPCRIGYVCRGGMCVADCDPPCRQGFRCEEGRCVSRCNPPCPSGLVCSNDGRRCVEEDEIAEETPSPLARPVLESGRCDPGEYYVDDMCQDKKDVIGAGNVAFVGATFFHGVGTLYSSAAPFIATTVFYGLQGTYDSYNPNGYSTDDTYMGYDGEAFLMVAPQTGAFVLGGFASHMARAKQLKYLRSLGASPSTTMYKISWVLYLSSLATGALTVVSMVSDNSSLVRMAGLVNANFMVASLAISVTDYSLSRRRLRKLMESQPDYSLKWFPYLQLGRNRSDAGMVLAF